MIFEESQEETERQERCARRDWPRISHKLKEKDKPTFFSLTNEWSLPAPSTTKSEEREFVVDSCASMHMVSRKDLNSAELGTVQVFKNPTTVMTANGEVESTVHVRELDFFVTVTLLENTLAVLSLGKLCEVHWFYYHWTCGQKPHLVRNIEPRTLRCSWSVDKLFQLSPTSPTSSSQEALNIRISKK